MNAAELAAVLDRHQKWLTEKKGGRRAELQGADLQGADLQGAELRGADLRSADLRGADLRGADLRGADLWDANLGYADLWDANLRGADLGGADLWGAYLGGGMTWDDYTATFVPMLCARRVPLTKVAEAWNCHTWTDCPMAVAFDAHEIDQIPPDCREAATWFVTLFDWGLIPKPVTA